MATRSVHKHPPQMAPVVSGPRTELLGLPGTIQMADMARHQAVELMKALSGQQRGAARKAGVSTHTSEALAELLDNQFGSIAPTVAAWCALLAWGEGEEASYRTWAKAFRRLAVAGPPFPQTDDRTIRQSL